MDERRKSARIRALKGARLFFNEGSSSRDCTIRNLSAGGAKMILETSLGIPDEFVLLFEDGARRRCRVRWRQLTELGVEFLPEPA